MSVRDDIVAQAREQIGAPYGTLSYGNDPSGFTCSGLTWWAYTHAGVDIPICQGINSYYTGSYNGWDTQAGWTLTHGHWEDDYDRIGVGDLLFFSPVGDPERTGHVAINVGGGMCIDATPGMGVAEREVPWSAGFVGGGWPLERLPEDDDAERHAREEAERLAREEEERRRKELAELQRVENNGGDVYRLYHEPSGNHHYTLNAGERDSLIKNGWKNEGVAWKARQGRRAVYRLCNPNNGDHIFTENFDEAKSAQESGWRYEGVPFMVSGIGPTVFRMYNPNSGLHMYTASQRERDQLRQAGWNWEGSFTA